MPSDRFRVVLDTNQIVGAGSRWLDHGVPTPDQNIHRRILIRVAEAHIGLYYGPVIGEYSGEADRSQSPAGTCSAE